MRALPALLVLVGCGGGDEGPSSGDPAGCGLPIPCGEASFDTRSTELEPRDAAECIYQALADGAPAQVTVVLRELREDWWDLYFGGPDPAVLVSQQCSLDGDCGELEFQRCELYPAADLDCSDGTGLPRVCPGPVNWCRSRLAVEPTCP